MGSGEIEACDLATSVAQDADQLALVGDAWTQPTDGVGVEVAGDSDLLPGRTGIFLSVGVKRLKKLIVYRSCFYDKKLTLKSGQAYKMDKHT